MVLAVFIAHQALPVPHKVNAARAPDGSIAYVVCEYAPADNA